MLGKYKYYFRKPRSEIVKDIFYSLAVGGAIALALTSPYFGVNLIKKYPDWRKHSKKKIYDTFYILKKRGFIKMEKKNHQIYIALTEEGKKKAGIFQIDSLEIKKPGKWDKKWRVLIFDIAQLKRVYREALRGKLKSLGFYQLQKSVWAHPFNCQAEVALLKDFFGLTEKEFRFMIVENIGDDKEIKKIFKLA